MSPVDPPLDAEGLRAALSVQLIGRRIIVLPETTSTNDVVAQMAATEAEGLVVIAERQTAGRGQYGRRWESAPGKGLWLSILLRPALAVADSARITAFLAETISRTLRETAPVEPRIKPPNDIYIADRKVAGVLVEMRVEPGGTYRAIAGLGLNVNQTSHDFPPELQATATSLALSAGHSIDRFALTVALLQNLDRGYPQLHG